MSYWVTPVIQKCVIFKQSLYVHNLLPCVSCTMWCFKLTIEKRYSETWELGTPKGLSKTVLNSEVVLFLRFISMYWMGIGTEVAVLNS